MKLSHFTLYCSLWQAISLSGVLAQQEGVETTALDEEIGPIVELEQFVVVGSRHQERSVLESPLPVDMIGGEDLSIQGYRDMDSLLSNILPSYNVNNQPISDAATLVRPANLRGLPPDATLVLINGKRRHRASVISFLGGGVSDGSQGPDLAAIPSIALERVEVLRDGASAQYGSDAIAGVLNFVLKEEAQGGTMEAGWGEFYKGDGLTRTIAANLGQPLTRRGFANFSFEYTTADPTVRSVQRADAEALINVNQSHISPYIRTPYAQIWGSPEIKYDFKSFANLGLELNENAELYAFASFAKREVEGGFFFRNPTNRGGVYRGIPGETIRVADLRANPDPDTVPVVRLIDVDGVLVPDPDDLAVVAADPNFFAFNEKFPGGFTPQFGGVVTDMSIASGLRGELESWWRYDVSAVIGRHKTEFYMRNTINPQTIVHPDFINNPASIPTDLEPGSYIETDYTLNMDWSRPFDVDFFDSPLGVAFGLEYRVEEFEIEAGEEYAWWVDGRDGGIAAQGFGVGSNGFPAFPPQIAGATNRGSYAAYLDLEANTAENVLFNVALRYEDHEDFNGILSGKLSSRWELAEDFALRGSVNTGFRVPSIGQASVRNVTTEFGALPGGGIGLRDRALLPQSEIPAVLGAKPLKEETSLNFSLGAVLHIPDIHLTLDYYHIEVKDRIALTDALDWPAEINNPNNYSAVSWFANDFDTTTRGIDLVADYHLDYEGGTTLLTFASNLSNTSVDRAGDFVDAVRVDQLESGLPNVRFTLSATTTLGPWRLLLPRLRYYGDFVEYTADVAGWKTKSDATMLVDMEVEYAFDNGVHLALGGQNLFNSYPGNTHPEAAAALGAPYPEASPYGFNGGFYYLRAAYDF